MATFHGLFRDIYVYIFLQTNATQLRSVVYCSHDTIAGITLAISSGHEPSKLSKTQTDVEVVIVQNINHDYSCQVLTTFMR